MKSIIEHQLNNHNVKIAVKWGLFPNCFKIVHIDWNIDNQLLSWVP